MFPKLLNYIMVFYTIVLILSIISLILLYKNLLEDKKISIAKTVLTIIIELCYLALLIETVYYFSKMPKNCSPSSLYSTMFFFTFLIVAIANFFNYAFRFLMVIIFFPIFVIYFIKDPTSFYQHIGIDPDIIDNLPQDTATEEHNNTLCVICSENIEIGDKIIILKCDGRHFFHSECIKMWLKRKMVCPYCRSTNIF